MNMFNAMVEDCRQELELLRSKNKSHYDDFERAWSWTLAEEKPEPRNGARLLVPFIGTGMNYLCKSGTKSWDELVKNIDVKAAFPWSEHELSVSRLSNPENLELALREIAEKKGGLCDEVVDEFRRTFGSPPSPSDFHKKIVELFQLIVTTNYERTLQQAENQHSAKTHILIDATDERHLKGTAPELWGNAILHLHGVWDDSDTGRVFLGVGNEELSGNPCLVLTESQYHRCYAHSRHFQRVVRRVFGPDYLLFFMGTGLKGDEFGIHMYLRDLQLSSTKQKQPFVGVYTGVDLNPARRALLESRGLACINLSSAYGQQRTVKEALWFALLRACSEAFGTKDRSRFPEKPVDETEIVCIGISSRHTVVSLKKKPSEESGERVEPNRMWDEVGGQHLVPALELAYQGRRVALVSRIGDDDRGDWVRKTAADMSPKTDCEKGNLDTQCVFHSNDSRKRETRRTLIVTYPHKAGSTTDNNKKDHSENKDNGGVRINFDYDNTDDPNWFGFDALPPEKKCALETLFERYKGARCLYVGPFETALSERAIEIINPTDVFVDTGTRGPGKDGDKTWTDFLDFLKTPRVTHVVASAKFFCRILNIGPKDGTTFEDEKSGAEYQDFLHSKFKKVKEQSTLFNECTKRLFDSTPNKTLVVTLGHHGAAFATTEGHSECVPIEGNNKEEGKAWIGCGDLFRSAFIDEFLKTKDLAASCRKGNEAGSKRVYRLQTLGHHRKEKEK